MEDDEEDEAGIGTDEDDDEEEEDDEADGVGVRVDATLHCSLPCCTLLSVSVCLSVTIVVYVDYGLLTMSAAVSTGEKGPHGQEARIRGRGRRSGRG